MKKSLTIWQFAGFLFTCIAGVLLHFLYDWSGQSLLAALFSAVNESVWEHMKLLFFPMLLFSLIQSQYLDKEYDNFWCAKLAGILTGLTLIPVLYYTYTGIFGVSVDWVNILIFFLTAAVSYLIETRLLKQNQGFSSPQTARLVLYLLALIFILFTFIPPQIPLFQTPVSSAVCSISDLINGKGRGCCEIDYSMEQ